MKIDKKHTIHIQTAFSEMMTRQDFLDLLNYAKPLVYGKNFKPFQLKQLTYYSNPKNTNKAYKEFQIKKKSGKARTIYAPENGLKAIQKTLAFVLQCVFEPHQAAKGFVMGKSVYDNAKEHTGQNYVYNIDLKDFFTSIDQARVWSCLKLKPFNLEDNHKVTKDIDLDEDVETGVRIIQTDHNEMIYYKMHHGFYLIFDKKGNAEKYKSRLEKENTNFKDDFERYLFSEKNKKELYALASSRRNLANMIAAISCAEMQVERINQKGDFESQKRNVLPQGAPTSPVFSNVVCQKLDRRLTGLAKRFNLKYTRYADDITFSSMHNVYNDEGVFIIELKRIIEDQGFHINESKTRLQKRGYRQEVTGLVVNDKINVRKNYVKQLRMWLYYWEKYGYEKAEQIFKKDYTREKEHVKNTGAKLYNVIDGKLEFLKMIKGIEDSTFIGLSERFNKLKEKISPLKEVLEVWENSGIDKAILKYKEINSTLPKFVTLKTFYSSIDAEDYQIKGSKIVFLDLEGKEIDKAHMSKKTKEKVSDESISSSIEDEVPKDNWNIAINGYNDDNWLFIKKSQGFNLVTINDIDIDLNF